jgi:tetratricopeptide (TPR) repeat protein
VNYVPRTLCFVAILAFFSAAGSVPAQSPQPQSPQGDSSAQPAQQDAAARAQAAPQVLAAESAIAANDLKTAQSTLENYVATHPGDARGLFDLGYVADSQNRLDDAADLYRKAIAADPKSFDAHLSLGLLLARQGKPDDARPELRAATTLDPGDGGPALKAHAWRALAQIDKPKT